MTGFLTEKLVKEPAFHYEQEKKDTEFFSSLMEEIRFLLFSVSHTFFILRSCSRWMKGEFLFKVLGRLKKAEIRGCGDVLSSKLKFANQDRILTAGQKRAFSAYYKEMDTWAVDGDTSRTIEAISQALKGCLSWIREQPIDALIGLIAKAVDKWKGETLSAAQAQGLKFLASWCSAEHLSQIANDGLRGNRYYADKFIPADHLGKKYEINDLKWVHKAISNLKVLLLGTYHGRCTKLQTYLDEFCFRFNRRMTGNQLFLRLTRAVATSCLLLS